MELHLKKNEAHEIMFGMVDSTTPESLASGVSVTDTAYYKDGAGSWTSLAITDTATEIASTGMYTIEMTAAELNHDLIMIKLTGSGAADTIVIIRTYAADVDDLVRSTTPANTLDVNANGQAGIDWGNVGNQTTSVTLSGTTIGTVTTNTDMRGTDNALLAASAPANFGDLAITVTTGRVDVGSIEGSDATDQIRDAVVDDSTRIDASALNALSALSPGSQLAAQSDVTGLNNLSTADIDARLAAIGLDHLLSASVTGTDVVDNSIFAKLVSKSATADWDDFVNTTDSLQAIRDTEPLGTAMRGTDNALLASSAPTNFGDLAITVTTGLVSVGTNNDKTGYDLNADQSGVTIGTCTTNTDMRGTDNALLAASAPTNFSDLSISATTGRVDVGSWVGTAVTLSSTTNKPEVDAYSISDDATAANNLELDYDGTGYNKANSTIGTCTTNTDMRGTDNALLAASAPTNFSDLAITVTTGLVSVGTNSDKTGYSLAADQSGVTVGTVNALGATAKSDVNAEVVDALATDTYAEPGQGAPGATVSLSAKIGYLYKAWRNKKDNDGSANQIYDDSGVTVDQKSTVSEAAGVVTRQEWVSGP
jgi:hypothetical protein